MADHPDPKVEEYRRNATAADERAKTVRDGEVRQMFLELARQWRDMAEQVERRWK